MNQQKEEFISRYLALKPGATRQEALHWWEIDDRISRDAQQPGWPNVKTKSPLFDWSRMEPI
jgi:hypothetical protein